MTPKMAHIYNRRILIERFPLKGEEVRRRRPRTAPKQHVVKYSPLHEYVKSRHPIDIFDGSRTAASNLGLAKVNERTSPSWSLGVRLKDPKSREVRPGPCQYDVADALDKRSQAHGNPRFTMGVKTPGYLDRPPQSSSGANIGIAPLRWDDSELLRRAGAGSECSTMLTAVLRRRRKEGIFAWHTAPPPRLQARRPRPRPRRLRRSRGDRT